MGLGHGFLVAGQMTTSRFISQPDLADSGIWTVGGDRGGDGRLVGDVELRAGEADRVVVRERVEQVATKLAARARDEDPHRAVPFAPRRSDAPPAFSGRHQSSRAR